MPRSSFAAVSLFVLLFVSPAFSKTVTYDWNITWTTANPDGRFDRATIGINGKWPVPAIEADKGDRVVVNMYNGLGDQSTSLHFHGLFQNGTSFMDGPATVTQCPVPPGHSLVYNFTVCISLATERLIESGVDLKNNRSTSQAHIGTIPTTPDSIPTASAGPSSFTTLRTLTKAATIPKSS